MPANLTPEYKRAEERFREAKGPDEKLAALEEMLRVMPKHKGTDGLQADIKARIAKLLIKPPDAQKNPLLHEVVSEAQEGGLRAFINVDRIKAGKCLIFYTHAQTLYGNGTKSGLKVFQTAIDRLHRHYGGRIQWMTGLEIARHFCPPDLDQTSSGIRYLSR